jgi:hypothetical protein
VNIKHRRAQYHEVVATSPPERRRRRFQFRTRTLFAFVTLLAIFIAYHVNWIRQRHAILHNAAHIDEVSPAGWLVTSHAPGPPVKAPGLLRFFGEKGYWGIDLKTWGHHDGEPFKTKEERRKEAEYVKRLFPEATYVSGLEWEPPLP